MTDLVAEVGQEVGEDKDQLSSGGQVPLEAMVVSADHLVDLVAEALEASAEEVPLVAVVPAEDFNL